MTEPNVRFEVSITSAAFREGASEILEQFSPNATIVGNGGAVAKSVTVPDWVVTASTVFTITGGALPTLEGFKALWNFALGLRTKYPAAPRTKLRLFDGETMDTIELEGSDREWAQQQVEEWVARHTPK